MLFTSYLTTNGTIIKLEDTPEDSLLSPLSEFIHKKGGCFTSESKKEFFLKKRLEPKEIEKIFAMVDINISYKKEEFEHITDLKVRKAMVEHSKVPELTFGRYKGRKITSVPKNYLSWLVDNHADKELIQACNEEIKTRGIVKII